MGPLRRELREPVTFIERVVTSIPDRAILALAIIAVGMASTLALIAVAADGGRTQGHAEVSGTAP